MGSLDGLAWSNEAYSDRVDISTRCGDDGWDDDEDEEDDGRDGGGEDSGNGGSGKGNISPSTNGTDGGLGDAGGKEEETVLGGSRVRRVDPSCGVAVAVCDELRVTGPERGLEAPREESPCLALGDLREDFGGAKT